MPQIRTQFVIDIGATPPQPSPYKGEGARATLQLARVRLILLQVI
jgi:hypothetical protein